MNRLSHEAVVERREILGRSAAAGHDDGVKAELEPTLAQTPHGAGDVGDGALPLNTHVHDRDVDRGAAAAHGVEHVLERGPGGAGHHRHAPREDREGFLRPRLEPAERLELGIQLLERLLGRTHTHRLDPLDDERGSASFGVELDAAGHDHLPAGLGPESRSSRGGCEHDAADDRALVLEIEVQVRSLAQRADLAHDPHAPGKSLRQALGDPRGQGGDGQGRRPARRLGRTAPLHVGQMRWIEREPSHAGS